MNIGLIIFAIIGSIIGLASTFYIVISMFWILGVKIVRRIKHGTPLRSVLFFVIHAANGIRSSDHFFPEKTGIRFLPEHPVNQPQYPA